MKRTTNTTIQNTVTFTREEILELLGIDLKDFFLAEINRNDKSLTFYER